MPFVMINVQLCFSLQNFLVIWLAIQKLACDSCSDAVVLSGLAVDLKAWWMFRIFFNFSLRCHLVASLQSEVPAKCFWLRFSYAICSEHVPENIEPLCYWSKKSRQISHKISLQYSKSIIIHRRVSAGALGEFFLFGHRGRGNESEAGPGGNPRRTEEGRTEGVSLDGGATCFFGAPPRKSFICLGASCLMGGNIVKKTQKQNPQKLSCLWVLVFRSSFSALHDLEESPSVCQKTRKDKEIHGS